MSNANTDDLEKLAQETADKFYERYINQKEWIAGKSITQKEFLDCLRNHILAALQRAVEAAEQRVLTTQLSDMSEELAKAFPNIEGTVIQRLAAQLADAKERIETEYDARQECHEAQKYWEGRAINAEAQLADKDAYLERVEIHLAEAKFQLTTAKEALEKQARLTAYYNGHPNGDAQFRPSTSAPERPIWEHYLCDEARDFLKDNGGK